MLGVSNEAWLSSGTIIGAVGTIAVPVVGWVFASIRAKHAAELAAVLASCKADIEKAKSDVAIEIKDLENELRAAEKQDDLHTASLKQAWTVLDDLRINGVRKQDQDRLRDEVRADMRTRGDRLEAAINALSEDIHNRKSGGL